MKKNIQSFDKRNREVHKPFLTGSPIDDRTISNSLKFCGVLILVFFITFITCSSISATGQIFRIVFSSVVILLVLFVFFNNGINLGADAVAKGEILYQKQLDGKGFSDSERKLCFHPWKAYLIGFFGSVPFLIIAVIFAINATITLTGAGTLPSWMQSYTRRKDIASALVSYMKPDGMMLTDYLRIAVRVFILPFVNIVGAQNSHGILLLEKLSPVILMLPAAAYGTGYLFGKKIRTKIHTMISENNLKRKKREIRMRKKRANSSVSSPEQLN